MDKQNITNQLIENHTDFISYIENLSDVDFMFKLNKKWSAGQQLNHIAICIKPILHVFSMPKMGIEQTFGLATRASETFDVLKENYLIKLNEGGKAPDRFLPEPVELNQKNELIEMLKMRIAELASKIDAFSELELDKYLIPHPLLGNLTLREMLFNVIQHVEHHKNQTEINLKSKN